MHVRNAMSRTAFCPPDLATPRNGVEIALWGWFRRECVGMCPVGGGGLEWIRVESWVPEKFEKPMESRFVEPRP